ncbi:MAG: flippase-like domain-containing protein [Candidatus Heimdallarchaeota archaeon]|nr:flippase-like domain-containing protein [Candidatus Heimdallarchaeota archaeon]MCK5048355.1 flippase-like domain-containing protein [Candidatus Heimdallarchaeota archaeon]
MRLSWKTVVAWIITLILLASVLLRADTTDVLDKALSPNIWYLIIAIIISFCSLIVKVIRWILLDPKLNKISVKDGTAYYTIAMYFSMLTIFKAGDAVKVVLLVTREKISSGIAIMSVITDRILETFAVVFMSFFGLMYYSEKAGVIPIKTDWILAMMAFILVLTCLTIINSEKFLPLVNRLDPFLNRFIAKFSSNSNGVNFEQVTIEFGKAFRSYLKRSKILLLTVFLSFLAWVLFSLQFVFIAAAYNLDLELNNLSDWYIIFFIVSTAALISQLPISIGGIGSRDYAYILLLEGLGYATVAVTTITLVQTFVGIIIPSVIGGFFVSSFLTTNSHDSKEEENDELVSEPIDT